MHSRTFIFYAPDVAQRARHLAKMLRKEGFRVTLHPVSGKRRKRLKLQAMRKRLRSPSLLLLSPEILQGSILLNFLDIAAGVKEGLPPVSVLLADLNVAEYMSDFMIDLRRVAPSKYEAKIKSIAGILQSKANIRPYAFPLEEYLRVISLRGSKDPSSQAPSSKYMVEFCGPVMGAIVGDNASVNLQYISPPDEPPAKVDKNATGEELPPRYADFTFFEFDARTKIPADHTLREGQPYFLEVAVRVKPSGIPHEGKERRPVREPKQKEPVTIWVVAESRDFEIDHPTQTLVLPPVGDSTRNARFRVTPREVSRDEKSLSRIKVGLYYKLNLLEDVVIHAEVVDSFESSSESLLRLEKPLLFRQRRLAREYLDFDNVRARSMTIQIDKDERGYEFRFRFRDGGSEEAVVLPARVRLQGTDLEDKIVAVREVWEEIALRELFARQVEGTQTSYSEDMWRLAEAGRTLWRTLFLRETEGSIAKVGDWLRDHAPERDALVQIHLDSDAADFVFPWTLLYDKELPKKEYLPIDPEGFWGLRYRLEQPLPSRPSPPDEPLRALKPLSLAFMLWDQFPNADDQVEMMTKLVTESQGNLAVSAPPVIRASVCRELLEAGNQQILYFYSHGYIRSRRQDVEGGSDFGQKFLKRYEKLDADSPDRESLKLLHEAISEAQSDSKRSFIKLTHGTLYLDDLKGLREIPGEPLVVLNMCESAERSPLLSESFVEFFLDRGAAAVLGTECPMTVQFAHPFSKSFLTSLLRGEEVGKALLEARREFIALKNPLGLAYTLYGQDTLSFEPACLPKADGEPTIVSVS